MDNNKSVTESSQQSENRDQNEVQKRQKVVVYASDLKAPTASETFKARVTCQRRS